MRIAIVIDRMTRPLGGLQRDCLRIAQIARDRGHDVTIFASRADCDLATPVSPPQPTSHARLQSLGAFVRGMSGTCDLVIGFNAIADLDILYCADPSYVARSHGLISRLRPRYRALKTLERSCFEPGGRTRILCVDQQQCDTYRRVWGTEAHRLHIVPENLPVERIEPQLRSGTGRIHMRKEMGIAESNFVWLHVSVYPLTKGLDRVIDMLPGFPDAVLIAAGFEPDGKHGRILAARAVAANVGDRIRFVGYREDIPALMAASDLLVHPANIDVTGVVVLEAICNGLPVIVSSNCGFARHVSAAQCGIVVEQADCIGELRSAIASAGEAARTVWSRNALNWSGQRDFTTPMEAVVAQMIDTCEMAAGRNR